MGLDHVLLMGALLFSIGLYGVLTRRNAIAVLMAVELLFNAVNINLVAFSRYITPSLMTGQIFALFIIAVAAAEAAVGIALILCLYRHRRSVYVDEADELQW
ncbi:MAG: NADH-quinone oxidoreductase subunit NuoK [Armatimonadetes bacterium]|nr:NADH-quinone oxidoreductase subunit NuoK [Armatimonadota bacterium]